MFCFHRIFVMNGVQCGIQERAVTFLTETKAQPQCWQICLQKYATTSYIEVRFWCLQTLHEVRLSFETHTAPALPNAVLFGMVRFVLQVLTTRYSSLDGNSCNSVCTALNITHVHNTLGDADTNTWLRVYVCCTKAA